VLPSGVTPLTAVATTMRYGDDSRVEVVFRDGHEEKHPLTVLADFVTEKRNPRNERMVAGVTVYLDVPVLAGGVELVDMPGTGSVFGWDTEAAHEALRTMDAAVFVLTADPPVSASEAAAELLDLDLAVPEPEGRLGEGGRFFFVTGEDIGQTELLAGAVRRRLPGEFGRRTAREQLRREVPGLVERQIGRARGDLQYRLAEATRALVRVVGQRYADGTGRIRSALQTAVGLREASAAGAAAKGRALAEREAVLRHALGLLDQAAESR
jgi:Dynamin family